MRALSILLLLTLCACDSQQTISEISSLKEEVSNLKSKFSEDQGLNKALEKRLAESESKIQLISETSSKNFASVESTIPIINMTSRRVNFLYQAYFSDGAKYQKLGTSKKGFTTIQSNCGSFLVSVEDVQSYLSGFRIKMKIANPSAITYDGIIFSVSYPKMRNRPSLTEDAPSEMILDQTSEFETSQTPLLKKFSPGRWTLVTIDLPNLKIEQLEQLQCTIKTDQVLILDDM